MMVPSTPVHKYMFIVDRGARKTGLDRSYLEPSSTSMVEIFAKIDVRLVSKYVSARIMC